MTDMKTEPKPDVNAVRDRVAEVIQLRDLRRSAVAREANVSQSVLSQFLADRYEGDNGGVAAKLSAWLDSLRNRDSLPAAIVARHSFVMTGAARRIIAGLTYAQAVGDLVVLVGEPGVGKTAALEHYRRTSSSVWIATMSADTAGQVPALEEVGFALSLPAGGGAAAIRRQIVARVRETAGVILIDEAQHLDFKALEALRGIHDATGIGMVLCGNHQLVKKVTQLPQVNSRVGRKVALRKPSRADVAAVVDRFGVTGEEETNFLHTIAQHPGGLRCVVKTVRLSANLTDSEADAVSMKHLADAWAEFALEDHA